MLLELLIYFLSTIILPIFAYKYGIWYLLKLLQNKYKFTFTKLLLIRMRISSLSLELFNSSLFLTSSGQTVTGSET